MRTPGLHLAAILLTLMLSFLHCSENTNCLCPEADEESNEAVITYLFREAWGDCPSGCMYSRYWYFECGPDGCILVGTWDRTVDRTPPEWWDEASAAITCFKSYWECPHSPRAECPEVNSTPRDNEEAEEAAVWLSSSLVAPDTLYLTVLEHLASIRAEHGDTIPKLNHIWFSPPWESGKVMLLLTREAMERFQAGEYHDLDSLNTSLGLVSMEHLFDSWSILTFRGRLNPHRLVDLYMAEPTVISGEPDGYLGDWSNVYPWVRTGTR